MNNDLVLEAYKRSCGLQPSYVGNYYPGKFFSSSWREVAKLRVAENPIFSNVHTLAVTNVGICGRFWVDPAHPYESSIAAGSAWFRPANERGGWETDSAISSFHLYLSDTYLKSLIAEVQPVREGVLEFTSKGLVSDPLIIQLITALSSCNHDARSTASRGYSLSLIRTLCLHLLTFHLAESKCQLPAAALTFDQLLTQISVYPAKDYKLEQMASDVSCSIQKLRTLFLNSTGLPPHRYIVEKRLESAWAELKNRSKAIAEIATSTGFFDQAHFTHAFRKKYRLTPREAREALTVKS